MELTIKETAGHRAYLQVKRAEPASLLAGYAARLAIIELGNTAGVQFTARQCRALALHLLALAEMVP